MAVLSSKISFVYRWNDVAKNMFYIGSHKGTFDDGYVCSSKIVLKEYNNKPYDFSRTILVIGSSYELIRSIETKMLEEVNAAKNPNYCNKTNSNGKFYCSGHSEEAKAKMSQSKLGNLKGPHFSETKAKMSNTWKHKQIYNCNNAVSITYWIGRHHTEESKENMRNSAKVHSATRSSSMKNNNPMKNSESVAKMLESRNRNRILNRVYN